MRTLHFKRLPGRVYQLLLLTLAASVLVTAFGTRQASASASGCAAGNPNLGPSYYCVTLNGSGTYVNYVQGTFRGSSFVCDYSITAEYFDTNWNWYQTQTSSTTWGCATGGGKTINVYSNKRRGYMCSTLRYRTPTFSGTRRMSVCHRIV